MATVTKPIALDESINTTEQTPRNIADVLAQELSNIAQSIGAINQKYKIVQTLPDTDISTTAIYLVPKSTAQTDNTYDEYINLTGTSLGWEKIGDTEIDLSGYYTSAEVDALLADKADVSDIPTVNDGTLTIQQNGETKGTFTANQSGNSTVNIEIPTTDIQTAVDEFETYNGGLLSECIIELVPVQSGSGDPSPDNVRPISGHTQVVVGDDGKNLCGEVFTHGIYSASNGTYYSHEGSASKYVAIGIIHVKGGQTYTFSWVDDSSNTATTSNAIFFKGNEFVSAMTLGSAKQIPVPENADGVALNLWSNANITSISEISISNPQLELGSTATPYVPYNGYQVTVNLGGTYYSGTLDVVSGVLTATHAEIDLGTLSWTRVTSNVFRASNSGMEVVADNVTADLTCEIYKKGNYTGLGDGEIAIRLGSQVWVRDSTVDDATIFTNQVNGKNFVYPLDTPTTIQLSPTTVKALVGENHLSAPLDGQEITESKYKQAFTFDDVIAYIQSLS